MRRIGLAVALAVGLTSAALTACAQTVSKIYRIGLLGTDSPSAHSKSLEGLRAGLRDLGYVEGKNIVIEQMGGGIPRSTRPPWRPNSWHSRSISS
jgi:hypothetical protein